MGDKLKILAVDDNSISLATIEQEFKGTYEVIALNSGLRALQYLKQQTPPDLIGANRRHRDIASYSGNESLSGYPCDYAHITA